jgi:hypothetical protein
MKPVGIEKMREFEKITREIVRPRDEMDEAIGKSQMEQEESGHPEDYHYGGHMFHHYWAIMNGHWDVLRRPADDKHPANRMDVVRMHPPEGIDPE